MALSGVSTYVPTINAFIAHWTSANAAAGNPIRLEAGFGLPELMALRAELEASIQDVAAKDRVRDEAAEVKDAKLTEVRDRSKQFRAAINSIMPSSVHAKRVPGLPTFTAAAKLQLTALEAVMEVWTAIDAGSPPIEHFAPPLILGGGYARGEAFADLTALRAAFNAFSHGESEAKLARAHRTNLMQTAAKRLRQYRQAAVAFLPSNHLLLSNLPEVAPKAGAAPPALELSGRWDREKQAAYLAWSNPSNVDHARFEVRYHPGPKYKSSEEQVVGTVLKGVLSVITDFGLTTPGAIAYFKVYNISGSGSEKGSNAIKVIHPDGGFEARYIEE